MKKFINGDIIVLCVGIIVTTLLIAGFLHIKKEKVKYKPLHEKEESVEKKRPDSYIEIGDTIIYRPAGNIFLVEHHEKKKSSKHSYVKLPKRTTTIVVLKTNESCFFTSKRVEEIEIAGHPMIKSLHNEVNKWGRKCVSGRSDQEMLEDWNEDASLYNLYKE